MKTAEEWIDRWLHEDSGIPAKERLQEALCKAYQQGCEDAVGVATKWYRNNCMTHNCDNGLGLQNDIWALREKKPEDF